MRLPAKIAATLAGVLCVCTAMTIPSAASSAPTPMKEANLVSSSAAPTYWLAGSAGGVGAYGGSTFYGSTSGKALNAPVVGIKPTPDDSGYWLVAGDGGIFPFGDAKFYGSVPGVLPAGVRLNQPVVGMDTSPDGKGYTLAAADGGVFTFGDAPFYGSVPAVLPAGVKLNQPVVGMAATRDGHGYWMVASDGGIFSFGDAPFYGSVPGVLPVGVNLKQPVVGMAPTPDGKGYWLVAADGGIFSFGDAPFYGSTGALRLNAPVVDMAATPDGGGYWLVAQDGGIFTFGDAPFRGSGSGYIPVGEWITSIAETQGSGSGTTGDYTNPIPVGAGPPYAHGAYGYDISWPQCGGTYPPPAPVAVVGVNGGSAFSTNPCFSSEAAWGGGNLSVYVNLNSPQGSNASEWGHGPAGNCALGDLNCESFNYGFNTAEASIQSAFVAGHGSRTWWLDIETGNYWTSDTQANDQVIAGALTAIQGSGYSAAIYSTNYQWGQIAGIYVPSVPVWYPTGVATSTPFHWCSTRSFAGGPVYLVQDAAGAFDGDYSC